MRKNIVFGGALFCAVALLSTGCVNLSTLQTARSLKPGDFEVVTGGGYYLSPELTEISSTDGETDLVGLPYLEAGLRVGVADGLDLGLKLTIPGTVALDGKYQFLDVGGFAMAAGAGIGYLRYESGSEGNKTQTDIIDLMVPVYMSYHPSDWLALYASPKYVVRLQPSSDIDPMHLFGAGGGLRFGDTVGAYLEGTYMVDLANPDFTMIQATAATFF